MPLPLFENNKMRDFTKLLLNSQTFWQHLAGQGSVLGAKSKLLAVATVVVGCGFAA